MGKKVSHNRRGTQRRRVARESAQLLYTGQEKEYRQAKQRAAEILGVNVLPNNAEIAMELNRIAEEREGPRRHRNLLQMRREALQIMQSLESFSPILVGSVWRGTARLDSDIDIVAYAQNPREVASTLENAQYAITKTDAQVVTKHGMNEPAFHIYLDLPSGHQAEIVVRSPESVDQRVKCEIFGDQITGLTVEQLRRIQRDNPQQKFLPT
ncbi:MAG: nucleotidyltransferase domain-containing protein [Candidatus Bathyarchaeota archaeon]|nr:MAG: nucleotidyltransferase domain-containing protein [Candidatus Bathyarchaeota archaeon]